MKKLLLSSILGMSAFAAHAAPIATVDFAPVPATHVYAPKGFDSNDNAEVIVAGYLPSLCYKAPRADARIDGKNITVTVNALKLTASYSCAALAVPFLESASAGPLDTGKYEIEVQSSLPAKRDSIGISEATSPAVDDFAYANVSSIERIPGTRNVLLKGKNPSPCFELDQVKYLSNGKDTYSVLPILKKTSETCQEKSTPFTYQWTVPQELAQKALLLHVRIMSGKSVNMIFDENE